MDKHIKDTLDQLVNEIQQGDQKSLSFIQAGANAAQQSHSQQTENQPPADPDAAFAQGAGLVLNLSLIHI